MTLLVTLQVGLVDIVDMYYEDLYTLPNKGLSSGVVANFTNLPKRKVLWCKFFSFYSWLNYDLLKSCFRMSCNA